MPRFTEMLSSVVAYPASALAIFITKTYRWALAIEGQATRKRLARAGTNVTVGPGCVFLPPEHVEIGNDVYVGPECTFMTSEARIHIGSKVIFAPQVAVITGNHNIGELSSRMFDVTKKRPSDDEDVTIEDDVWIGFRATILKGVTIGTGSVIAAGAVVTSNVEPYDVVGGVPARRLYNRRDLAK